MEKWKRQIVLGDNFFKSQRGESPLIHFIVTPNGPQDNQGFTPFA